MLGRRLSVARLTAGMAGGGVAGSVGGVARLAGVGRGYTVALSWRVARVLARIAAVVVMLLLLLLLLMVLLPGMMMMLLLLVVVTLVVGGGGAGGGVTRGSVGGVHLV